MNIPIIPMDRLFSQRMAWASGRLAGLIAVATLLSACGSNPKYVESSGPDTLVTQNINIQDFSMAAERMVNSLLASGVLEKKEGDEPAVLAVSRVVNNTGQHFDMDLLTKQIRVSLNKSGKVLTTTTLSGTGQAEDPLAKEMKDREQFRTGKKAPTPDYSLSGKIIETQARLNRRRQTTYTFQLALTDKRGLAVWEDQEQFTKQSKRPAIGW